MEQWCKIRRLVLVDGVSKRAIMRRYRIHHTTLKKILLNAEPPGYRQSQPRQQPKLEPFLPIIRAIIEADRQAPPKQRHTARRILERLRKEHCFLGGYTIVKQAVRELRQHGQEVFVPLLHRPGEAQVDYGTVWVEVGGVLQKAALFVMSLPYSNVVLAWVFPRECTESFQEGHVRSFQWLGGVPREIRYDNLKIAVAGVDGHQREWTLEFTRLQSHFLFQPEFCRVRRPNEKGHVERLLEYVRRNFLVPIPRGATWEELNTQLAQRCLEDLWRPVRGRDKTKGELLAEDRACLLALPSAPFEVRRVEKHLVNSLSLVRFRRNDYSVPVRYAHHRATVVGTLWEVRVIVGAAEVARHVRCWEKERVFLDPVHYLALLERKPGALDDARPLAGWELPPCFALLRRRLEEDAERYGGTREYIRVLRLLEHCTLNELTAAVEQALNLSTPQAETVRLILEYRREVPVALFCLDGHPRLSQVRVAPVDLSAYRVLTPSWAAEVRP